MRIFWDYYEEVGAPEISSLDDLIPILKEIQKKHPTDPVGNKIYAVGSYYNASDFNLLGAYTSMFAKSATVSVGRMAMMDQVEGTVELLYAAVFRW